MIPAIFVALLVAHTGAHAKGMRARVACDTIHAPDENGTGNVVRVVPGDVGRVAWTDAGSMHRATYVYVRDQHGVVRTVGHAGGGPGEFRNINEMIWHHDTLWVTDAGLSRFQAFSENGKFLLGRIVDHLASLIPMADGAMVGVVTVAPAAFTQSHAKVIELQLLGLAIVSSNARGTDTLLRLPTPAPADSKELMTLAQPVRIAHNFDGSLWCAMANPPGKTGLALHCVTPSGQSTVDDIRHFPTRPVTNAIWQGAIREAGPGMTEATVLEVFHRTLTLAAAYDLLVNRNGDIWLRRSHRSEPAETWDRLHRDGKQFASLTIPPHVQVRALDGAFYYGASIDDNDLQTLIRCPIP